MVEASKNVIDPDDLWDVIQFSTDEKGRQHWVRIGRAWQKSGMSSISVRLFAIPIANKEAEVVFTLVPKQ